MPATFRSPPPLSSILFLCRLLETLASGFDSSSSEFFFLRPDSIPLFDPHSQLAFSLSLSVSGSQAYQQFSNLSKIAMLYRRAVANADEQEADWVSRLLTSLPKSIGEW